MFKSQVLQSIGKLPQAALVKLAPKLEEMLEDADSDVELTLEQLLEDEDSEVGISALQVIGILPEAALLQLAPKLEAMLEGKDSDVLSSVMPTLGQLA